MQRLPDNIAGAVITDKLHTLARQRNLRKKSTVGRCNCVQKQTGISHFRAMLPAEPPASPPSRTDQITAIESTVTGLDNEKQPYEVTAKRGWQDEATPSLVHLEEPQGTFRRAAGTEYTISAETGLYDTAAKKLDLTGNVELEQKDRFKARMDRAEVVVEEKRLVSDSPVAVIFGSGTVNANGMQITDDGARILFLNGVKARFDVTQAKGDEKQ